MSEILEGFEYYKSVQGIKYNKNMSKEKEILSKFHKELGKFTDDIFIQRNGCILIKKGNWIKGNGTSIQEYLWNRYKPQEDKYNLVIYFNANAKIGLFISIGLIDDKLTPFENTIKDEIYKYLEHECKQIHCEGFKKIDLGAGERAFLIEDINNFKNLNYNLLINQLKDVYIKTINKFYSESQNSNNIDFRNKQVINQILYGPPGTGKTYNTINKALEILGIDTSNKSRKELTNEFKKYKENGQIEFVTFHQSYGYEEFVEGIKANLDRDEIRYKLEDGIFKKLSIEALFENIVFDDFQKDLNYAELYEVLITKFKKENLLKLNSKDNKSIELRAISNKENLYCYHHDSDVKHTVGKDRLKKLYDVYNSLDDLSNLSGFHDEFTNIIGGANQTIYWTILNQLLIYKEELKKEESDETIDYETKKDLIYNNPKTKFKKESKNYILIIDEINRGNISKIFGELITLIEESKRLGKDEQIEITLPYSREKFGVPTNLYIIGTMNTADRSVAPIDTALRRRFVFEEMSPNPSLLLDNCDGVDLEKLLEAINTRIEYLYDRDHTIGHAYLIDVKNLDDLKFAFKNKIIPLLAEYFYEDWENIKLVLDDTSDKFINVKEKGNSPVLKNMDKNYNKKLFSVGDIYTLTYKDFINIYEIISPDSDEK